MSDVEIQLHLLREKTESSQAIQTAIKMEIGVLQEIRISSATPLTINRVQKIGVYCPAIRQQQTNTNFTKRNESNQCHKCRPAWKLTRKHNFFPLKKVH